MSIWAIGDLHLSLGPRIQKPMDVFGGCWVNHDSRLKEIWNRMIAPDDLVILAGDLSWALRLEDALYDLAWIDALPGTKLIIKGNHDLWWSSISKIRNACQDLKTLHFLQYDAFAWHDAVIFGTRGWVCPGAKEYSEEADGAIYRREVLRLQMSAKEAERLVQMRQEEIGRKPVLISVMHYPPMNEKLETNGFLEVFESIGVQKVVYGHLHGQNAFKNGPQGTIRGIEFELISLDRLECCPKRIHAESENVYENV